MDRSEFSGLFVANRRLAKIIVTGASCAATVWASHGDLGITLLASVFVASLLGLLDGRISISIGLVCLACCPILLLADQQAWLQQSNLVNYYVTSIGIYSLSGAANSVATWAYYFMCIGVVALILRYIRQRREA